MLVTIEHPCLLTNCRDLTQIHQWKIYFKYELSASIVSSWDLRSLNSIFRWSNNPWSATCWMTLQVNCFPVLFQCSDQCVFSCELIAENWGSKCLGEWELGWASAFWGSLAQMLSKLRVQPCRIGEARQFAWPVCFLLTVLVNNATKECVNGNFCFSFLCSRLSLDSPLAEEQNWWIWSWEHQFFRSQWNG